MTIGMEEPSTRLAGDPVDLRVESESGSIESWFEPVFHRRNPNIVGLKPTAFIGRLTEFEGCLSGGPVL